MRISITDEDLEELLSLEAQVKPLLKRIAEIRTACKAYGSFYTANHVCTVKIQERKIIAGLAEVTRFIDSKILERYGLIRESKAYIVHISRLEDRINLTP